MEIFHGSISIKGGLKKHSAALPQFLWHLRGREAGFSLCFGYAAQHCPQYDVLRGGTQASNKHAVGSQKVLENLPHPAKSLCIYCFRNITETKLQKRPFKLAIFKLEKHPCFSITRIKFPGRHLRKKIMLFRRQEDIPLEGCRKTCWHFLMPIACIIKHQTRTHIHFTLPPVSPYCSIASTDLGQGTSCLNYLSSRNFSFLCVPQKTFCSILLCYLVQAHSLQCRQS